MDTFAQLVESNSGIVITFLLTVIGVLLSILGTRYGWLGQKHNQKKLHYKILGNSIAINHDKTKETGLTLLDKNGKEVNGNVGILEIQFLNQGFQSISKQEIRDPLRIFFNDANRILDFYIGDDTTSVGNPGFDVFLFEEEEGKDEYRTKEHGKLFYLKEVELDENKEYGRLFTPHYLKEVGLDENIERPFSKCVGITWESFNKGSYITLSILYETNKTVGSEHKLLVAGSTFSDKDLINHTNLTQRRQYLTHLFRFSFTTIIVFTLLIFVNRDAVSFTDLNLFNSTILSTILASGTIIGTLTIDIFVSLRKTLSQK